MYVASTRFFVECAVCLAWLASATLGTVSCHEFKSQHDKFGSLMPGSLMPNPPTNMTPTKIVFIRFSRILSMGL